MITTNPEMNESLIQNLELRGDNLSLYAIQRIKELEQQVSALKQPRNAKKEPNWSLNSIINSNFMNGGAYIGTHPMPEPVGKFIIDNESNPVMQPDGAYYHYSNVCGLLNKYKKKVIEPYRLALKEIIDINDLTEYPEDADKALDKVGKLASKTLEENHTL
jgi:hypothetical protein